MTMSATNAGGRPGLSREVVAERAVALGDAEGVEAVTVRRLARDFGVTSMALYWHFHTKDDLLAGIGDHILDSVEVPEAGGDWATDVRATMVALVTALKPHPQLAGLVTARLAEHPHGLALTERGLRSLGEAGFDPETATYLALHALRVALATVAPLEGDKRGSLSEEDLDASVRHKTALLASLPPQAYPTLVAHAPVIANALCRDEDTTMMIDVFVAGVQALSGRLG
jgi:TetR/AcrR family tetracycline transcriptional repressor